MPQANARLQSRRRLQVYTAWFLLLLTLVAILFALIPLKPLQRDLAVTFLGTTNNPVRSMRPVRLEVVQGANGLCAVFEVKSLAKNCYIQFEQEAVERRVEGGWVMSSRSAQHLGIGGDVWTPGYSCFYALPWPAELPTNATWRAVVSVQRELGGWRLWLNRRLGREIFKQPPYGKHTIYSSEVDGSVPFLMPK